MQIFWILLMAAICAESVSAVYTSRWHLTHGRQLTLDLPERTEKLEFTSADEQEHSIIWEKKAFTLWNKPTKGQVFSANDGWTYIIKHVTFDDEGTYTLRNYWSSVVSSYTLKVDSETLTIPLEGLKQSDATLRFYSNYSTVTLVESGVPVGRKDPDYANRLKVGNDKIQVLKVNVSDLGRYELTDHKGRFVSNTTMLLVDHHEFTPNKGLLGLLLLGIPTGLCYCCRKRICKCRNTKTRNTHTVQSYSLNPIPETIPPSSTVIDPAGPEGPGQGFAPVYPPFPDQGQIHYPPQPQWNGQPAVPHNPGFNPEYVPLNPVYPPNVGPGAPPAQPPQYNVPPSQYNPSAPVGYTPVMNSAPTGPELKMNELSPAAPLLMSESATPTFSIDVLNSSDTGVQFTIDKGKSSSNNFL
ncbi:uncharacterized protein wu:fc21g02 isoform X2 [Myxocyprinus asiaticus]|uniref:uncharacterized protein wu:fc21g02 isoform X2 n=1 Tax=Myxocyprinus asiaticus TaxID=70543 RepID=UPI002221D327|nr:uncharacterized protein wu:fc21g02 isoform X2 [Myxocyprinus asiaticus]